MKMNVLFLNRHTHNTLVHLLTDTDTDKVVLF